MRKKDDRDRAGFRAAVARSRVLLLMGTALLLTGCLDLSAELEMNEDGSGRFELEYRLSPESYEMAVFDRESSYVPVPIHEDDLRRVAAGIDGLALRDYRLQRGENEFVVTAALRFDDLEALNRFYSPGEERIRFEQAAGTNGADTRLTVELHPGAVGELDEDTRSFAETYLQDYRMEMRITVPEPIRGRENLSSGDDERSAGISASLGELFTGDAPQRVWLEW